MSNGENSRPDPTIEHLQTPEELKRKHLEQQWEQSENSLGMVDILRVNSNLGSERKLRLFAIACCREIGYLIKHPDSQKALEMIEQYVDDKDSKKLQQASVIAERVARESENERRRNDQANVIDFGALCVANAAMASAESEHNNNPTQLYLEFSNSVIYSSSSAYSEANDQPVNNWLNPPERAKEQLKVQSSLLHEIFHNPFINPEKKPKIESEWLAWNDGGISKLAQAIYDAKRFDELPILADALEDAGCTNEDILNHCRGAGPHVRGCWVLDLLLEKS